MRGRDLGEFPLDSLERDRKLLCAKGGGLLTDRILPLGTGQQPTRKDARGYGQYQRERNRLHRHHASPPAWPAEA